MPSNQALKKKNAPAGLKIAVERLVKAQALTVPEAGNVLTGGVTLDKILLRKAVRRVMRKGRDRSCLEDAAKAGGKIALFPHRSEAMAGRVLGISDHQIAFEPESAGGTKGPVFMIDKVKIAYACHPAFLAAVEAAKAVNGRVRDMGLSIPVKARDRTRFRHDALQRYMQDKAALKFLLFDGTLFQGSIRWWSLYEIGIDAGKGVSLTLFRHAVLGLSEADNTVVTIWKGLESPGKKKPEPPKSSARAEDPADRPGNRANRARRARPTDPVGEMTKAQAEIWRVVENRSAPWTVAEIAKLASRSVPTVNKAVNLFLEAGLVKATTDRVRNRTFVRV